MKREIHKNLRGGMGEVTTYTSVVRSFGFFGPKKGKFIILVLGPKASIGMHRHEKDSEIYVTLNRKIRFCRSKQWAMTNHCKRGNVHSAKNLGNKKALIFAYKY